MNPFVALPILLSLTDGRATAEVRRLGLMATFYASVLCVVVAVAGQPILSLFGITIDDLRVAGGLVLFVIGLGMVTGTSAPAKPKASDGVSDAVEADLAFYSLAFPMTVGPGTIATILIVTSQANAITQYGAVAAALVGVLVIMGVVLFFATSIGGYLSQKLRVIVTRVMGLILTAIASELVTSGLKILLPGLA